jgi:DNA-binding NarL/FixJ family response regulator
MIRILLAEDHEVVRAGIRSLLEKQPDFEVVAEASNGVEVLSLIKKGVEPDIVLADIYMPEMDGLVLADKLKNQLPDVKVIVLSMLADEKFVIDAFHSGVSGYLMKNIDREELIFAIRHVCMGKEYICSDLGMRMFRRIGRQIGKYSESSDAIGLTVKELEVLHLIADGLTNEEIAEHLYTNKRTVEGYRKNLIEKAGVKNTAALIQYAFRTEIIK